MAVKVGINGFGRIGRMVFRAGINNDNIEFISVNDLPIPAAQLAHLLKYDSVMGTLDLDIKAEDGAIIINDKKIKITSFSSPDQIPWADLGVEYVLESSGVFRSKEQVEGHLKAGAKKVIITAPGKGDIPTFVLGVNQDAYDKDKDNVVSNASCTTNCVAPMAKILNDEFGIVHGLMTTIHAYTNDQNLQDGPHKADLRRARAAALSMIPTSTGAAKATSLVIPELEGKLDGIAIRVPTPTVSVTDLVVELNKEASKEDINAAVKKASETSLKGILKYTETPLVSSDYIKDPASCIFDAELTTAIDSKMAKVFGWYDNEWGYSCRVIELVEYMSSK